MDNDPEIVAHLQQTCSEVFDAVTTQLTPNLSEADIARQLDLAFRDRGISGHWYDVPFNVLIGPERFIEGLTASDYAIKAPSEIVKLTTGSTLYIDFAPVDSASGQWGDWSKTIVFRPRFSLDDEQLSFIDEISAIQREGIKRITANTTGADIANYYLAEFKKRNITLQDVRNNVGHSIHKGRKSDANRVWLDTANTTPLGGGVFTVEPGGSRPKKNGNGLVVARFEVCIYIPPEGGETIILGE